MVLPNCPVVSTLISPQNYFTDYTSVTAIYAWVESMPGLTRRSHIFTLPLQTTCSLLVFSCPSLLSFIFSLTHLFTPGRKKATVTLLDLNLPHPILLCKHLKKRPFFGFPLRVATVTMSLDQNIFKPPGCPGKLGPCQSQQS